MRYRASGFLLVLAVCSVALSQQDAAVSQECHDLGPNRDLIKQSDRYLERNRVLPEHPLRLYTRSEVGLGYQTAKDYVPPPEKVDCMTTPLCDVNDLSYLKRKADALENAGNRVLAAKIRHRIKAASADLFGKPLTQQKIECISVAEQLRDRAWTCEKRGLYPMAEKLYGRVVAIYEKEIGAMPKTAGVIADLARVYAESGQPTEASAAYDRALGIYEKHGDSTAEMASLVENYAAFLEQRGAKSLAEAQYNRAARLRRQLASQAKRVRTEDTWPLKPITLLKPSQPNPATRGKPVRLPQETPEHKTF